jgi:hypothetical protein
MTAGVVHITNLTPPGSDNPYALVKAAIGLDQARLCISGRGLQSSTL